MNRKDKAYQLYEKFFTITPEDLTNDECVLFAKQCALIAVDEIILSHEMAVFCEYIVLGFWKEVKQEIEKL